MIVRIGANTIVPTGGLHIVAVGKITGTAGTKTIRFKFGGTVLVITADNAASLFDWYFEAWCFNSATNAQRWMIHLRNDSTQSDRVAYVTTAFDTTQNQTILISGQLGNAGDTLMQTIFDIFLVQ